MSTTPASPPEGTSNFEQQAQAKPPGFIAEFFGFLKHNKKWWLTPIVLVLLLAALLIFFSGSVLAPFIYPVF